MSGRSNCLHWGMLEYGKLFLTFVAGVFVTAALEPHFVSMLRDVGWYDTPTEFVGWIGVRLIEFVGPDRFPWIAGGLAGTAIGVWLDKLLRWFTKDQPDKETLLLRFGNLLHELEEWTTNIASNWDRNAKRLPFEQVSLDFTATVRRMSIEARNLGISVPDFEQLHDQKLLMAVAIFAKELKPLAYGCHLKEIRRLSKELIKDQAFQT